MFSLTPLAAFVFAMVGTLALVPVCRSVARRFGYVSVPKADRWHHRPTPLLGGVAIVLPVLAGVLLTGNAASHWVLITCVGLVAALGLVDDLRSLSPATKLVGQIALASVFLLMDYRLHWVESLTLDSLLTVVWLVGITNAFNLLDNMDGLCAGIALIAGTSFLLGARGLEPAGDAFLTATYLPLLLGAVTGFLVYNISPASIFMGDAGSLFLGMSLAGITLVGERTSGEPSLLSVVAAPVLILLIPILDTTLVTVSRVLSGRSAAQGGRDHSSHRLVAIGLSERRAVAVLWTLAAVVGVAGFWVRSLDVGSSILIISTILLAMTVFTVYLLNVRVYEGPELHGLLRAGRVTPLVVDFVYKRRVAEVLLDACLVPIAYYGAYRLRFEGAQLQPNFANFLQSLPVVMASQLIALFAVGAYRGVWRYFSLIDSVTVGRAAVAGTVGALVVVLYLYRFESYSRTVFVIYAALVFILLTASRASFRLLDEFATRQGQVGQRLVIYGAGTGGSLAVRAVPTMVTRYKLTGFIDDDPHKQRLRVQGYTVLGTFERLQELIRQQGIDAVLLSSSAIDPSRVAALEELAAQHGIRILQLGVSIQDRERPPTPPVVEPPPAPIAPSVH